MKFFLNALVCFNCTPTPAQASAAPIVESLTSDLPLVKPQTWRLKLFVLSRRLQVALEESDSDGNAD